MSDTCEDQGGHSPQWPPFLEKNWISRTLAFYDPAGNIIITEGEETYDLLSFHEFLSTLFVHNLLLFVDNLLEFPYISELISYEKCTAIGNKRGNPLAMRIRGQRNTTRWIIQADSWHTLCSQEFLLHLRATYDHCQAGTPSTPGGLGQALMRRAYKEEWPGDTEWYKHRHTRPNSACQHDILEHMTGGRVDTPRLGETFEYLTEIDQKNAYLAHYAKQPGGAAIRLLYGNTAQFATFFVECDVTIHQQLVLGPFPIRIKKKHQDDIYYPSTPGTYHTWLWKEQIEDAVHLGCTVQQHQGWGWLGFTEDNTSWCKLISRLRDTAPSEEVEKFLKLAIVAAIGRHGMDDYHYTLVDKEHASREDIQVSFTSNDEQGEGTIYPWFIHKTRDFLQANQSHWFAYTIMQCARSLYHHAMRYAVDGSLVATNYDALYLEGDIPGYECKEPGIYFPDGAWRKTLLTHATIPYPRAIDSDQKKRFPGTRR